MSATQSHRQSCNPLEHFRHSLRFAAGPILFLTVTLTILLTCPTESIACETATDLSYNSAQASARGIAPHFANFGIRLSSTHRVMASCTNERDISVKSGRDNVLFVMAFADDGGCEDLVGPGCNTCEQDGGDDFCDVNTHNWSTSDRDVLVSVTDEDYVCTTGPTADCPQAMACAASDLKYDESAQLFTWKPQLWGQSCTHCYTNFSGGAHTIAAAYNDFVFYSGDSSIGSPLDNWDVQYRLVIPEDTNWGFHDEVASEYCGSISLSFSIALSEGGTTTKQLCGTDYEVSPFTGGGTYADGTTDDEDCHDFAYDSDWTSLGTINPSDNFRVGFEVTLEGFEIHATRESCTNGGIVGFDCTDSEPLTVEIYLLLCDNN